MTKNSESEQSKRSLLPAPQTQSLQTNVTSIYPHLDMPSDETEGQRTEDLLVLPQDTDDFGWSVIPRKRQRMTQPMVSSKHVRMSSESSTTSAFYSSPAYRSAPSVISKSKTHHNIASFLNIGSSNQSDIYDNKSDSERTSVSDRADPFPTQTQDMADKISPQATPLPLISTPSNEKKPAYIYGQQQQPANKKTIDVDAACADLVEIVFKELGIERENPFQVLNFDHLWNLISFKWQHLDAETQAKVAQMISQNVLGLPLFPKGFTSKTNSSTRETTIINISVFFFFLELFAKQRLYFFLIIVSLKKLVIVLYGLNFSQTISKFFNNNEKRKLIFP
ncbi:hypothetical protein RFI_19663 [Reticulomyxa filosa]|uniref:Uncharacterized protein n=1 Tax=Reticulomyxa filosa TaxID=46433 RepID=X6MUJ3_RETFI|nr:hypothetical protein RFI_19663 [Reticulomyxa filosa]|eukprot:ETO17658.1 hypothetical protein RFI_19663 [Reticulomyxa filosa]